jgi:multiple sugar transport system substrate-binding protein
VAGARISRRTLIGSAFGAALAAGFGGLSGCAPGSSGSGGSGGSNGQIRFTFWGPAFYQDFTRRMVDGFTSSTGIQVALEPSEWSGYWDKLAVQVAAGDQPDVINMDGKYLAEYGSRGVLADLSTASGLDVSGLSSTDLDAGKVDGKLYAVSTGSNAFAVLANPTLFEQSGVDLPNDRTWTWEDYADLGRRLSRDKVVGISGGGTYADLTIFLRQHGEDLFSADGVGYRNETLAAWFQGFLDRQNSGASQSAAKAAEDGSVSLEQQAFATNTAGMTWMWTNQLESVRTASGHDDIMLLRPPSMRGDAKKNGLFLKASMYWSISARSKRPEEGAQLVNYLLNDPAAAKIQLFNRGVPSDPDVLAVMKDSLTATDEDVLAFLEGVAPELSPTPPALQPVGASDSQNTITRYLSEVRFERLTPMDAATKTTEEITQMIATGRQ